MRRNLLVGMGALVCLVLGAAPARAQQWLVLNQKTAGTAPKVTITQYEARGGGNTNYNITVSFFSKAPLKAMTIKINDAVVSGPVPAAQAGLITYGGYNNDLGLAQPGALVTVWMLDALGREASLSYTIKPWP